MSTKQSGRTETLAEIDALIGALESAQQKIKARRRAPTVDLTSAIIQAQEIRDRIERSTSGLTWQRVQDCTRFMLEVAKSIGSMINCILSQIGRYESWVAHKTPQDSQWQLTG